jgi:hypothetical protein
VTVGIPDEITTIADDAAELIAHPLRRDVAVATESPGVYTWTHGELEALVRICSAEVQLLEGLAHDLITERLLSTAVGAQLDQWGKRLGCERYGLGDEDYRALLYVWIAAQHSDGQAQLIQKVVRLLMGAAAVLYGQSGEAHFTISWDLATPSTATRRALLERILNMAVALGVGWTAVEGDSDGFFGFSENACPNCLGFDQGGLSDLITQV